MFFEMRGEIIYGNSRLAYSVMFSNRKTLAIEVHPDGKILVIAPLSATAPKIEERLRKRAAWIARQLRHFSKSKANYRKIEWVSGETMYYLGRQYRLKICKGYNEVRIDGRYLKVFVNKKEDVKLIEKLVSKWYANQARRYLHERFDRHSSVLGMEKIKVQGLIVRKLEKRWGSCTRNKNIVLNRDLIKVPVHCIDYVMLHEICHLKFLNHGKRFWTTLSKYCPDWQKRKRRLENFPVAWE